MPTRTITRRLWHFWLAWTIVAVFALTMLFANVLFFASLLAPWLPRPAVTTVVQSAAGPRVEQVAQEQQQPDPRIWTFPLARINPPIVED
jgi:hypothetical protein